MAMTRRRDASGRSSSTRLDTVQRPFCDPRRVAAVGSRPPRALLYARRYVALDDYRRDLARGAFKNLSRDDKLQLFGSVIMPIHVPLAPHETKDQYEMRFRSWLAKQGLTPEELERDTDENLERYYRFNFATENARGLVQFKAPEDERPCEKTRDRRPDERASRKRSQASADLDTKGHAQQDDRIDKQARTDSSGSNCSLSLPGGTASVAAVVAAHTACGCRQCLTRAMYDLVEVVTWGEQVSSCRCSTELPARRDGAAPSPDRVEAKLLAAYDELNEQLVLNEAVLEAEVARLATTPVKDIDETKRLHDENQELREMLHDEMGARSVALARLIVYLWRYELSDLERRVHDPTASNVTSVQRACHSRNVRLAAAITNEQTTITTINRQLVDASNGDTTKHRLETKREQAEASIEQLRDQRRQQFRVLLHFDADLRQLIQSLLSKAQQHLDLGKRL